MLLAILTFISLKYRIVMENAYIFLRTMLIGPRVLHRVSGTGGSEIVPPGGKIPRGMAHTGGEHRGARLDREGCKFSQNLDIFCHFLKNMEFFMQFLYIFRNIFWGKKLDWQGGPLCWVFDGGIRGIRGDFKKVTVTSITLVLSRSVGTVCSCGRGPHRVWLAYQPWAPRAPRCHLDTHKSF